MLICELGDSMEQSLRRLQGSQRPHTLVENRTSYAGEDVQFSVYDTYKDAYHVALRSAHPMYCGMITGKKVIHLAEADAEPFDFLPGESLVIPPLETVYIDFPEASQYPTKCVTLEIDTDKVRHVIARANEAMPRSEASGPWTEDDLEFYHFDNPASISRVVHTLVDLFAEDTTNRDLLVDLKACELIVRMLQTRSRRFLVDQSARLAPRNGIAAAVQHIKKNLDQPLNVSDLAEVACMSESSFYRYFRNEFGMTPLQYITEARMARARDLLKDQSMSVGQVSEAVGFSSVSHFISTFKDAYDVTPKQYQLRRRERLSG